MDFNVSDYLLKVGEVKGVLCAVVRKREVQ